MAQINLLPWRERLREERKREFFTTIAGILIIAAGVVFLVDRYFRGAIDNQNARNAYLQEQIVELDRRVAEINELQQQKEEIRSRMDVIQNLQGSRPIIVRVFDELVRTLPSGVYFTRVQRETSTIMIDGAAESYARLTELMRRLDGSDWFSNADLKIISTPDTQPVDVGYGNIFTLNLTIDSPRDNLEEDGL